VKQVYLFGLTILLLWCLPATASEPRYNTFAEPPTVWVSVWGGTGWVVSGMDAAELSSNFDFGARLEFGHPNRLGLSYEFQRFEEPHRTLSATGAADSYQPRLNIGITALTYGFVPTFNNGLTLTFRTGPAMFRRKDFADNNSPIDGLETRTDTHLGALIQGGLGYHINTTTTINGLFQYSITTKIENLDPQRQIRNWTRHTMMLLLQCTFGF